MISDLARILDEQCAARDALLALPAGHRDLAGIQLWLADAVMEEVLLRREFEEHSNSPTRRFRLAAAR